MRDANSKRGRGRPPKGDQAKARNDDRHTTPRKVFHAPAELFERLAKYRESLKEPLPDAVCLRVALTEYLERRGF